MRWGGGKVSYTYPFILQKSGKFMLSISIDVNTKTNHTLPANRREQGLLVGLPFQPHKNSQVSSIIFRRWSMASSSSRYFRFIFPRFIRRDIKFVTFIQGFFVALFFSPFSLVFRPSFVFFFHPFSLFSSYFSSLSKALALDSLHTCVCVPCKMYMMVR